jgi:NADPH:quinone reductase-like Zn-dependent oxidoreductase
VGLVVEWMISAARTRRDAWENQTKSPKAAVFLGLRRFKLCHAHRTIRSPTAIASAWRGIIPLIFRGSVKPIVEWVYPFGGASEASRHMIEDRPFGKVVLAR